MDVTAWSNGKDTFGIRIGARNREKHFTRGWSQVVIEIDHMPRSFQINNGFWLKCPEIRDVKESWIEQWLRANFTLPWVPYHPPKFKLIPLGNRLFRVSL